MCDIATDLLLFASAWKKKELEKMETLRLKFIKG